ncbi:MAG: hypothetical protein EP330_09910 [Deltaproteobacteria bacterium]|nr:MAG: hypothetical protein EP330_09910 [Deltaproteobacteria bacterium]
MSEGRPILPHQAAEFYTWLWWSSERNEGVFDLGDPLGRVDVWVDERLAFRTPGDSKVTAVLTGDNPSATLEARAALAGGKVLEELRLGIRRDDREYAITLKGAPMHFTRLKLPQVLLEGEDSVIYDRMHLYEEVESVIGALFRQFAGVRSEGDWESTTLQHIRKWILAAEDE